MADEYELMPAVELEKLRQEVEALKKSPVGMANTKSLQESIENLTGAINRLLRVFSSIDEELIKEAQSVEGLKEDVQALKKGHYQQPTQEEPAQQQEFFAEEPVQHYAEPEPQDYPQNAMPLSAVNPEPLDEHKKKFGLFK